MGFGVVKSPGRFTAYNKKDSMPTVAIIGAGPLGRWLALEAARAGFSVLLEDVMPSNLHHAEREAIRAELGPDALPSVTFVSTIEDAVRNADLIIDCVPDELESKLEILWLLDRMAPPHSVFATPTTRLSIGDLANCTYRPEKCIAIVAEARAAFFGRQWANPVAHDGHVLPLQPQRCSTTSGVA